MQTSTAILNRLKRKANVETLVFMTDQGRVSDLERVLYSLPEGSIVILRDYECPDRDVLAANMCSICRKRGLYFLVAGDFTLAQKVKADGVHVPEYMLFDYRTARQFKGVSMVTAACHSQKALTRAASLGVSAAFVSPVFATNSHKGARPMGIHAFSRLIAKTRIPIIALGGISFGTVGRLKSINIAGIAAIDGIVRPALGIKQ
ncbi:thiamine phosphate synthase [Kordiimonas sp. SCSIO 12610]|uniref:thiamine phosphate synthase n=1 Tax=Kordiimonas sp. SCSIO 12610 TaxID=2829597 RepID=UPI00210D0329|nr:thiamine phosphate synthase [Kordiimonas sp. SCSIO 12610]UTW55450.1 thiamine phosphate synthase [Kordiimonas sp. SCSIO 12610]